MKGLRVLLASLFTLSLPLFMAACGDGGSVPTTEPTPTVTPAPTALSTPVARALTPSPSESRVPTPPGPTPSATSTWPPESTETPPVEPTPPPTVTAAPTAIATEVETPPVQPAQSVTAVATPAPISTRRTIGERVAAAEGATNWFPNGVVFSISAASTASDILKVTLRYEIMPGVPAYGVPEFNPGPQVQADFHLDTSAGQLYLAPGAEIPYHWEIEDAAGNTLSTEPAIFVYEDTRFVWQAARDGNVWVHWYGRPDAQSYLQVARDTLDRMSALLGAQVDFSVKVWVYESNDDMLPALPRVSEGQEIERRTAGVRVTSDTVLMLADGGGDILRHELAHVVTKVAGEGPYGGLPAWLDEGTAVYAQSEPGEGFVSALEGAVDRDLLLSVRSMTSPTGDMDRVSLFYGQAWSLVKFLIETYGPERLAQLFAAFKGGNTTDKALQKVYGFDQDGLENAWRASLALPARSAAPAQSTASGSP